MSAPTLLVAAPHSGAGKTLLTLGLIRALVHRGLKVGSFKVGPDFIDPVFHARASGGVCHNLDSWAMRFPTLTGLLHETGQDADIVVGEGVMGLFDGAPDSTGSTADLAALFGLPVVLVADAARIGQSIAALLEGYIRFRDNVEVVAIVLNRVGSERHARTLIAACDDRFATPIVGWLPADPALTVPSRHLGLVQADEIAGLEALVERAATMVAERLDLDRLVRLARRPNVAVLGPATPPLPPPGERVAVACDTAFAFAYPALLDGWRVAGATLHPFSPLADEAPDATADAVYLPGGYPELHAGRLAGNARFIAGLRATAARGAVVYGECGGYMVMGETLVDRDGTGHAMAALLPVVTSFAEPRRSLGYRRVTALADSFLGRAGCGFRGHEFHYARELERAGEALFETSDAAGTALGPQGVRRGGLMGSFVHLVDR